MLNILLPIAGRGSRFATAGYQLPKPLIPVHGVPMIKLVVENLRPSQPHRYIFLALQEHIERYDFGNALVAMAPGSVVVPVAAVTEGAACTALLARQHIENDDPLMIANTDQWVDVDINDYLGRMERDVLDGLIMTMWADDNKWSFVGVDDAGLANRVVEKEVISNEATVGIYNYRRGRDFVEAADAMIAKNLRVNNEFYVAPAYNEMIKNGAKVGCYNIGKLFDGMYGIGVPEDLERFLRLDISRRATESR